MNLNTDHMRKEFSEEVLHSTIALHFRQCFASTICSAKNEK